MQHIIGWVRSASVPGMSLEFLATLQNFGLGSGTLMRRSSLAPGRRALFLATGIVSTWALDLRGFRGTGICRGVKPTCSFIPEIPRGRISWGVLLSFAGPLVLVFRI